MNIIWDDFHLRKAVYEAAELRLRKVGEMIVTDVKRSFGSGASGYKERYVTKKKISHWSSVPPLPPHVDTGRLRASISYSMSTDKKDRGEIKNPSRETKITDAVGRPTAIPGEIILVIGSNVEYARALELGFAPRNLKPRPYLVPGLHRAIIKIQWLFGR